VHVLDSENRRVGELDGIYDGTITSSTDARIKTAGRLSFAGHDYIEWWGRTRLQPWVRVNGVEWNLGVFIPSSPTQRFGPHDVEFSIDIYDLLTILDEDCVAHVHSIPEGTNLIDHVLELISSAGVNQVAITPSDTVNAYPMTWEAGTPKLSIINDILDYCEYFSLTCNQDGVFVATPYVLPKDRPIAWKLYDGEKAVHSATYTHTRNLYSVPNRVVYLVQTAGTGIPGVPEQYELRASYENHDPKSMFSYENRGRWVTQVKTDADATTQEELDEKVKKRIVRAQNPMEKLEIENAVLPLKLNEIVLFKSEHIWLVGAVRKWEMTLRPGELMKTTIRAANVEINWYEKNDGEDED